MWMRSFFFNIKCSFNCLKCTNNHVYQVFNHMFISCCQTLKPFSINLSEKILVESSTDDKTQWNGSGENLKKDKSLFTNYVCPQTSFTPWTLSDNEYKRHRNYPQLAVFFMTAEGWNWCFIFCAGDRWVSVSKTGNIWVPRMQKNATMPPSNNKHLVFTIWPWRKALVQTPECCMIAGVEWVEQFWLLTW